MRIPRGPNQFHSDPGCYTLLFILWWKCIESTVILIVCRSSYTVQMSKVSTDTQGNNSKVKSFKLRKKSYRSNIQWYRIPLFWSSQECTLLFQPHDMPTRRQSRLSIRFTTVFVIPHAIYIAQLSLTLYKHQGQLNLSLDYVSWWIAKIISSYLPLLRAFNVSKHSLLNIPTNQVRKRGYTQPTFSENTDSEQYLRNKITTRTRQI